MESRIIGYSRSREGNGEITGRHFKDISNTVHSSTGGGGNTDMFVGVPELRMEDGCLVDAKGKHYRIRKLTPREVGRLMDVSDEDIDRIEATGLSKTAMYKMYGNSIVVNVMFHIFRKLFIEKDNENQQLSLF